MSLAAIMTKKVRVTTEDATLASLRTLFTDARFQHVPVIDSMHRLVGIVSVKDYFKALSPVMDSASEHTIELYIQSRKVRQVMTSPVISVSQDLGILQAAALLVERNISCLPVVDQQQRLIGIVSWKDIMRRIVQSQQKRLQQTEEEE
ncbi:CBS domain-containing protein [Rheinheimera riviphila]|uniref:CBS domain-containing protein n=1 Tax=Rheinheimera riviphila TaxID=1834037 RepID=A0A437QSA2_9GAMM|nr:CBS domain-containing protein [Rheinheimera riviphila]RVU37387.1 CBS domain-containing protein [Rheinheimera riviphila]